MQLSLKIQNIFSVTSSNVSLQEFYSFFKFYLKEKLGIKPTFSFHENS